MLKPLHSQVEWDQDGGAYHSAHVPRRRPSAAASSFTSLRGTPHRPDRAPPRHAITRIADGAASGVGGLERSLSPDPRGLLGLCKTTTVEQLK